MFEKCLIQHCSPTLAGIKTASLFAYGYCSEELFLEEIRQCNMQLRNKGIVVSVMKKQDHRALIYVYRKNKFSQMIHDSNVSEFLKNYGYSMDFEGRVLATLKQRISCNVDFPHEIGVFLGYPLEDVIGFIKNAGKNCKCFGCWKVYCNECEARRTFERYKKCTNIYMNLYQCGIPVTKLTVAA